jgi:hypothetical protein
LCLKRLLFAPTKPNTDTAPEERKKKMAVAQRARQRATVVIGGHEFTLARTRRRNPRISRELREKLNTVGQRLAARITLLDPQVKQLGGELDADKARARDEIASLLVPIGVEGYRNLETGEGLVFKVDRGYVVTDPWQVLDAVATSDQGHTLKAVVLPEAVLQALGRRGRKKVLTVIRDELAHLPKEARAQVGVQPDWNKLLRAEKRRWLKLPPGSYRQKDPTIAVSPVKAA